MEAGQSWSRGVPVRAVPFGRDQFEVARVEVAPGRGDGALRSAVSGPRDYQPPVLGRQRGDSGTQQLDVVGGGSRAGAAPAQRAGRRLTSVVAVGEKPMTTTP